ncbi:type IV pilin protein, partial [Neisseria chenwenguii]
MKQIHPQTRLSGFTLTELLVTLAITGILATVAYPLYRDHVRAANLRAAHAAL